MQTLFFTILIILICSGLISMVEASLFSVSISKAKILVAQKRKGSTNLVMLKENMQKPITVLVILNNIFNIIGSMIVGLITTKILGSFWIGIVSVIFTFLIILFAEIVPKSIGTRYSEKIGLLAAKPLLIIAKIFSPIVWIIEKLTCVFAQNQEIVSEEEIKILSHLGHLGGTIEEDEREMIHKVFKLNDLTAKEIMTPRTVITALDGNKTLNELESRIFESAQSRLPVYKKNLDEITGVCQQRELLIALAKGQKGKKIKDFQHNVPFVYSNTKSDVLLTMFQKKETHLAIVVDEFGGTSGIVTLEDVLEQLVGEIVDEKDKKIGVKDTRQKAKKIKENLLNKIE